MLLHRVTAVLVATVFLFPSSHSFLVVPRHSVRVSIATSHLFNNSPKDDLPEFELPEEKAERMQEKANQLRQQIRDMEKEIASTRAQKKIPEKQPPTQVMPPTTGPTLRNKRILVAGANGRLGSMVCRYLLRNHPEIKELVAVVHYVGEASTRGYGRLSYEVGAEDGRGTIGAFWNGDERTASFVYDGEVMSGHNLQKLRVVEAELLDPVQCQTICEGVDSIIYCASDFDGNKPRALGLDFAFLFRAVASPTKGRAEIEGLENMLGGLKLAKLDSNNKEGTSNPENDPINFVLVSMVPEAFKDFETPFGEFNGIKRQAERKLADFPSIKSTVLQMGRYEDNFVEEDQSVTVDSNRSKEGRNRLINRRDAAKAAVDALLKEEIVGRVVQVYSAVR